MTLEIHFLDVGQGDCTVLLFKQDDTVVRSVVIDCGGTNAFGTGELQDDNKDDQQAGRKLLAFYRKHGIAAFDIWIITHWDKDHFGGFNYVLKTAKTKKSVRTMVADLTIYDRGECFNYSFRNEWFTTGFKNSKTPYVSFRSLLSEVKRIDKGLKLERSTERVYGNHNYDRRKFRLNTESRGFRFISSEPDEQQQYVFRAPDYLLGEDLLNRGYQTQLGARLECLVVNGHYRNKAGTTVAIDVTGLSTDVENCRSMGLLLTFGDFSCWLGGDLESGVEDRLIPVIKARLGDRPLSLLKAGHHGSHFSTSDEFINQLQPDTLIVSSPPESRLHPHPIFLKRIAENDTIKAVYLTGCHPYVGDDLDHDGYTGSVIEGVTTSQLLGLSGELVRTDRKFYVCGGTEHSSNKTYNGDICVSTRGDEKKHVTYWEAFGELVLSSRNPDDIYDTEPDTISIESVVDRSGELYDGFFVDHDRTGSKSIRLEKTTVRQKKGAKKRKHDDDSIVVIYELDGRTVTDTLRQAKKRRRN